MGTKRCPTFCRIDCTIRHHPLLIALINMGTSTSYTALEATINRYNRLGNWTVCDEITDDDPDYCYPLLHWAACLGNVNLVKWFIRKHNVCLFAKCKSTGDTALHTAIHSLQRRPVVEASRMFSNLLEVLSGLLPVQNAQGDTPLHLVCTCLDEEQRGILYYTRCVKAILKFSLSTGGGFPVRLVNTQNNEGDTPIHIMARHDRNYRVLITMVTHCSGELNLINRKKQNALDVAMELGALRISSFLAKIFPRDGESRKRVSDARGMMLDSEETNVISNSGETNMTTGLKTSKISQHNDNRSLMLISKANDCIPKVISKANADDNMCQLNSRTNRNDSTPKSISKATANEGTPKVQTPLVNNVVSSTDTESPKGTNVMTTPCGIMHKKATPDVSPRKVTSRVTTGQTSPVVVSSKYSSPSPSKKRKVNTVMVPEFDDNSPASIQWNSDPDSSMTHKVSSSVNVRVSCTCDNADNNCSLVNDWPDNDSSDNHLSDDDSPDNASPDNASPDSHFHSIHDWDERSEIIESISLSTMSEKTPEMSTSTSPVPVSVLEESRIQSIAEAAARLAQDLHLIQAKKLNMKKPINQEIMEVVRMSEDDPNRMKELRKYAAVYGRFDAKVKEQKSKLSPHQISVNEAAAQLCRHHAELLTRPEDLFILARQIAKYGQYVYPKGHSRASAVTVQGVPLMSPVKIEPCDEDYDQDVSTDSIEIDVAEDNDDITPDSNLPVPDIIIASVISLSDTQHKEQTKCTDSSPGNALMDYLSICGNDSRNTILTALANDRQNYLKQKEHLLGQVKDVKKEIDDAETEMEQKNRRLQSILREVEQLQIGVFQLAKVSQKQKKHARDLNDSIRDVDKKLECCDKALENFSSL